jgi:predicted translin family RNA/ssDNA-binding protein
MIDPLAQALQAQDMRNLFEEFVSIRLDYLLDGVDFNQIHDLPGVFRQAYLMGVSDGATELRALMRWE